MYSVHNLECTQCIEDKDGGNWVIIQETQLSSEAGKAAGSAMILYNKETVSRDLAL